MARFAHSDATSAAVANLITPDNFGAKMSEVDGGADSEPAVRASLRARAWAGTFGSGDRGCLVR